MLIQIKCNKFREKTIVFHQGLNVVVGDEKASNSIGKSSALMVIDFAFGGDDLIKKRSDIVTELGDHDYYFHFKFSNEDYYFRRGTLSSDLVHECDQEYSDTQPIPIKEYRDFLKSAYALDHLDLTFRSTVSLFSRIWGKDNLNVKNPLHVFQNQSPTNCVDNLLKLYEQYKQISELSLNVKALKEESAAIRNAFKQDLIPKITKSKYKQNAARVSEISDEISDIKKNLAKYAVSLGEIVNREVSDLKNQKDALLNEKGKISARLNRVRNDLDQNKHVKSKSFSGLKQFFPEIDESRVVEVEEFHSKITKILKSELKKSENELSNTLDTLNNSIGKIDVQLGSVFSQIDNPEIIIDRVHELANSHVSAITENRYYETKCNVHENLNDAKKELATEKERVLKFTEDIINDKMKQLVSKVYDEKRKSPKLSLSQSNYTLSAIEDTGTGKAYSNLILFDLTALKITDLPFLIHDSVLYKNIETTAVSHLMDLYASVGKQVFISIDEVKKYGAGAEKVILDNKILELSENSVLYIKDWRS